MHLNIKKHLSCTCAFTFLVSVGVFVPQISYAESLPKPALIGLAKEFVNRIGDGFDQTDARPENIRNILTQGVAQPNSSIPDGEELIMGALTSSKKIPLNNDIITIKQPYGLDILLADFFSSADFAIRVDNENGTAKGWFIRQDQTFALDINANTVTIKGQAFSLNKGDAFILDGELYAKSPAIEAWFGLDFDIKYNELQILIESEQDLPAVERFNRRNRDFSLQKFSSDPTLPFEEVNYRAFDIPFLDVNIRGTHFDSAASDPQTSLDWSLIGAGDFAYFNTRTFLAGDEEDTLTTLRLTFERESEENDLLGPLRARRFSFGDVNTTRLQLSGGSNQEQGIRITNTPSTRLTNRNTTVFRGDAQPDWDAELYRGDRLVAFQTVGEDGQYEFLDVELFAGSNPFTILLLGPQGEIQEIKENIPVRNNDLNTGRQFYDVSVSRNDEVTFERNVAEQEQDGEPHIVARYDIGLSNATSLFTGFQSRDEGDARRNYIEAGVNTKIGDTFLDLNTAYEENDGELAAEITARRRFGSTSLRGNIFASTEGFQPGPNNETNPIQFETNFFLDGRLNNFFGLRANYGLSQDLQVFADSSHDFDLGANISTRYKNLIFNNNLTFEQLRDNTGNTEDFVRYILNARGLYKGGFFRLSGNYDLVPEAQLIQLFASYNYPFSPKLDGLFEIEHDLDPSVTEFVSSLNWKADKATISPRLSYDTDETLQASVNVRFGVGHNPTTRETGIFNQRLSTTGGVSARVFLDANGNGILDDGEELIEGAELDAVQAQKSSLSDENGIAFIPDLPRGRITDIKIDTASLEDPYWIPNYDGISLRPRPGVVKEIEFPIVVSGEIDGTVYFQKDSKNTPARQFKLHLIAPWGEIVQTTSTAFDGFYIFGEIPPGVYYIIADYDDLTQTKYDGPPPQRVELKPDGTTIFGNDIYLTQGPATPYQFTSDIEPTSRKNKRVLQNTGDNYANIRLGPFKSKLAATLNLYTFKRNKNTLNQPIEILSKIGDLKRTPEDQLFWVDTNFQNSEISTAQDLCKSLQNLKVPCEINIHTNAYNPENISG